MHIKTHWCSPTLLLTQDICTKEKMCLLERLWQEDGRCFLRVVQKPELILRMSCG